jgi:hypothetical protein
MERMDISLITTLVSIQVVRRPRKSYLQSPPSLWYNDLLFIFLF